VPFQIVELTPPGRGAIATLLVEGPGALAAAGASFHAKGARSLTDYPKDRLVFGHFGAADGQEVVIRCRAQDSVEVHCLGGPAAVAMIQTALLEQGGHVCAWEDWIAAHETDPIAAAARQALAKARTLRTSAILLDQYHGALRLELADIDRALRTGDRGSALARLDTLLARAPVGRHLTEPWQVVLAGSPNVGKSSLVNAMVGYPRAIVHPAPGTTRDVVSVTTAMDGWPVELSDTAGLHVGGGAVERAGVQRAREKVAAADLVLLVFDRSVPWSKVDEDLIRAWPNGLVVHNKCDLAAAGAGRPPGIATSALSGQRVEELVCTIAQRLVPRPPPAGAAVPFASDQVEHLVRLRG